MPLSACHVSFTGSHPIMSSSVSDEAVDISSVHMVSVLNKIVLCCESNGILLTASLVQN